ncbi:MAG TPA: MBL fold metallo-hydrolase [Kofleriaceae bacterium]|nr:MBL fold metallo-hydrolase [Kofleriaceae bacterium]
MKRCLLLVAVLAGCPAPAATTLPPPRHPPPPGEVTRPPHPTGPTITWRRVESADDVPRTPPPPGTYRVHLIDVGTGLSILIQGHAFNMLYDAGTNDPAETPHRVLSYLALAIGPSGDDLCVDKGAPPPAQRLPLAHVVLSHPHLDHGSALDLVVHCYDVRDVWDSGRVNDAAFYRDFLTAVGASATVHYHTAASVPVDHVVGVKGTEVRIAQWERFSEGDTVRLDETASFTILHAEPKPVRDPNQNSVVLSVELGGARVMLVGDAESGARKDPREAPGGVERFLLDHHAPAMHADILQVGHHGSLTSSRHAFLAAVKPRYALVSSGPRRYGKVTLPDPEVITELKQLGAEVLRTDEHDAACPLAQRIGGDTGPGGCDSYVITIEPAAH